MKKSWIQIRSILLCGVVLASAVAILAGCGEDNKPPDDKSYYTGPMKPKGAPSEQVGGGTQ